MSTFEGPMMSIKAVNSLSHYTDWTIGHVHSGALGWDGMITFGAIYFLVPRLWNRERLYSLRLVNWHFWLATLGIVLYAAVDVGLRHHAGPDVARVRRAGLPGLFLRRDASRPCTPTTSSAPSAACCYLAGALIMACNVCMTIRGHQRQEAPMPGSAPALQPAQ